MTRPLLGLLSMAACSARLVADPLLVPNASFESPATPFVNTHVDAWQKTPKPDWYVESGGYTWEQLAGLFKNTPATSPDHITNCDGNQALWLFAIPELGLFQDYDSTDWANPNPTHAFDVTFEVGKSYRLTVGVIGGGGNMAPGATLELSLYYRDAASNQVPVAATSITNSPDLFSNTTSFIDFRVDVPAVKAGDAWAGRKVGLRLLSTVSLDLQGGYWDLENIRLSASRPPAWRSSVSSNGQFSLTLESEAGLRFEILASTDAGLVISNWTSLGTFTNVTGTSSFTDPATHFNHRFYRARLLP